MVVSRYWVAIGIRVGKWKLIKYYIHTGLHPPFLILDVVYSTASERSSGLDFVRFRPPNTCSLINQREVVSGEALLARTALLTFDDWLTLRMGRPKWFSKGISINDCGWIWLG
jgi:hypothetical protein